MSRPKVLVAFDSMRYPNTGLFHFGKSLGRALLRKNADKFDLNFFLHPKTTEFDADNVPIIRLRKYHKLFYFNTHKIELFHFTDQLPRLAPAKVGGKKILTIHDINPVHEAPGSKAEAYYLKKLSSHIRHCDRVVAISQFAANDVLKYFPKIKDKLSVIYNGADKLQVTPGHSPAYVPNKPFLFAIGIVSAKKNFAVLPALLAGNDRELVIAGIKTPYEAEIMAEAIKHGCADRVTITGPVSEADKAWYYSNCEAFVFPSIAEGFGLPVIEAMHFGKPVFCSNYTSLPEVAGDAAYYFDSFRAEAMRKVFNKGMQHFHQNNGAEKAIAHAAKYNWDYTAKQYLALYTECLAGR
ncbi:glycosyltransferase family 4 protein [Mucilaginibacter psychrotolerans]|uniref:Glycosyltransferase family 1 protein n=1 Tax=Mucilaginibacter psychrotolerans TaxID=1524096 RepID=A0A4Y8S7C5_9SPHI|nr:glycosyltransferase family 1 protein [Mucilaginibacter psychrotolerans]TFF34822.1 glycosyltransferase family 1 protein [Mucilaginibacter psychrotolerans]